MSTPQQLREWSGRDQGTAESADELDAFADAWERDLAELAHVERSLADMTAAAVERTLKCGLCGMSKINCGGDKCPQGIAEMNAALNDAGGPHISGQTNAAGQEKEPRRTGKAAASVETPVPAAPDGELTREEISSIETALMEGGSFELAIRWREHCDRQAAQDALVLENARIVAAIETERDELRTQATMFEDVMAALTAELKTAINRYDEEVAKNVALETILTARVSELNAAQHQIAALEAKLRERGVTGEMVDRFLNWPLPESVSSDVVVCTYGRTGRVGTNLLTADEARQMLEYVLAAAPAQPADGEGT